MSPKSVIVFFLVCISSALAQLSPFFGGFPVHFSSPFSGFSGPVGSSSSFPAGSSSSFPAGSSSSFPAGSSPSFPAEGGGRTNTGPILFPPAPESRDTSGVIVGASGYGFVPPGGKDIVPARDIPSASFSGSFGSQFGSQPFFHL